MCKTGDFIRKHGVLKEELLKRIERALVRAMSKVELIDEKKNTKELMEMTGFSVFNEMAKASAFDAKLRVAERNMPLW